MHKPKLKTPTHLFFNTFKVLKPVRSLDSGNSHTERYPEDDVELAALTEYRGYLNNNPTTESMIVGAERTTGGALLYCSPSVQIDQIDKILSDGVTYFVTGLDKDAVNCLQVVTLEERR